MTYSTAALDAMLATITSGAYVSAHSSNPGTNGANELSTSGYTRQSLTFGAPYNVSGGRAVDLQGSVEITVASGSTVSHLGLFSAASGGTFRKNLDINDATFSNPGTLTVSNITLSITE